MGEPRRGLDAQPLPNNRQAWDIYNIDQIWQMLHDEDGIDNFRQVTAWYRMAHLCTDQADQLEKALGQLMTKWPPNPGSAAQAFKLRIDALILSMRDSATAAKANEEPLIRITSLISDAKDAILDLKQQRAATAKAESEWIQQNQTRFAPILPPQFEPGWQDTIDRQARDIMFTTDQAIGQAATEFRTPTEYLRQLGPREVPGPFDPGGSTTQPRRSIPVPVLDPPSSPAPRLDGEGNETHSGPDLDGPALDGGLMPLANQTSLISGPALTAAYVDTPLGRVLAPGGVIGAVGDGSGNRTGASSGAVAEGSHTAAGVSGMFPPPVGRGMSQREASNATKSGGRRRRRSDPDDPWVPPSGGPSVLEPAPEPDHFDPGPNVIGIDRCFIPDASVMSVAVHRGAKNLYGRTRLEAALYALLQRMRRQCTARNTNGLVFFDEGHPEYRKLYRQAQVYLPTGSMFAGWPTGAAKNLPLDMFTKDGNEKPSKHCHFTQAADLLAYAAFLKINAERRALTDWQAKYRLGTLYDEAPLRIKNVAAQKKWPRDAIVRLK